MNPLLKLLSTAATGALDVWVGIFTGVALVLGLPPGSSGRVGYRDDQKHFEFENFYDEYAKPRQERRLPMEHRPYERGVEVYRRWWESSL